MKRIHVIFLVLTLQLICCFSSIAESQVQSELTLMIYMCGSNLESSSGAASADLEEMIFSDFDTDRVNLLVMVGGTKTWDFGFDPDKVSILEISPGGQVAVWNSDGQMDMSNEDTLTSFIRFCADNYPAENYALILWDHGGGPLEGVCWDELFSMNHMKYPRLVSAIRNARLGKKLSWIGFDACLMSSLEIASDLSYVADYMIASQETEPSVGWNYSFLECIEEDESPAETGKRIVDAYFENQDDSHDILTLACTDLSKASEASKALGSYFESIEQDLSAESFPLLSNLRMSSVAFGKSVRSIEGDEGYDLVDARDLVQHMAQSEEKEKVLSLLDECIVYSRSNEDGAYGLTLYHPYSNKSKYLSGWKRSYGAMNLIDGYTKYVQSFGTLLTGSELVRWTDLYTGSNGRNDAGEFTFSVQLNEEQATHFASAQLLIVRDTTKKSTLGEGVAIVSVSKASLDEDGILKGVYDESALYVEQEDGSLIGPLSYFQTDDGKFDVVTTGFIQNGEYSIANAKNVLFYLDASDQSRYPEIYRTRIWDDATQSYSSRLTFDESLYRMVTFWNRNKAYPGKSDGILPEYNLWKTGQAISLFQLPLPESWRFTRLKGQLTGAQLYAMFQITDSQQNIYCTVPVAADNPNLVPFASKDGELDSTESTLSLSGLIDKSEDMQSVRLILAVKNNGKSGTFRAKELLINGSREVPEVSQGIEILTGQEETLEIVIDSVSLALLDEIRDVSFLLVKETSDSESHTDRVHFNLEGCDLSILKPYVSLGHGDQNQISMDVIQIIPDSYNGFDIWVLIDNQLGNTLYPDTMLINSFELYGNCIKSVSSGKSKVLHFSWEDGLSVDNTDLSIPENQNAYYITHIVTDLLALHGKSEIEEIGITFKDSEGLSSKRYSISAALNTPLSVEKPSNPGAYGIEFPVIFPPEANEDINLVSISETDRYVVQMHRIILSGSEVFLVLEVTNYTGQFIDMLAKNMYLNGTNIGSSAPSVDRILNTFTVAPKGTKTVAVKLKKYDGLDNRTEVRSLSIAVSAQDDETLSPALITLLEPASTGSLTWISPDHVDVQQAQIEERKGNDEISLLGEFIVPENMLQYRRWIEAPLSKEELENVEEGEMVLVWPVQDSIMAVITYQALTQSEDGRLGAWFPGLVGCTESDETNLLTFTFGKTSDENFSAGIFSKIKIMNEDIRNTKTLWMTSVRFTLDYLNNTVEIKKIETDGDEIDSKSDMAFAQWFAYLIDMKEDTSGNLPLFEDIRVASEYTGVCEEALDGKPLQIKLRPIQKEDGMKILFSFKCKDHTDYSILIPYDEVAK